MLAFTAQPMPLLLLTKWGQKGGGDEVSSKEDPYVWSGERRTFASLPYTNKTVAITDLSCLYSMGDPLLGSPS